jgi:hypothetical protein
MLPIAPLAPGSAVEYTTLTAGGVSGSVMFDFVGDAALVRVGLVDIQMNVTTRATTRKEAETIQSIWFFIGVCSKFYH